MSNLAIFGGSKSVTMDPGDMFTWPIYTIEEEEAVLKVLRERAMSATAITMEFEKEFAKWQGSKYALAYTNGTMSLTAAMFGVGLGVGDEIICPSVTYWATILSAYTLGATPVFADIDPDTLCVDPRDIERCISDRTKAIMVVHYLSHPADMDAIMAIAAKHNIKVIEDHSHAQGGFYKGRRIGTIGHVSATSMMTGKSFAVGEGGILTTDDQTIYERALAACHYERFNDKIITPELKPYNGLPLLGMKGRVNQFSSAIGLVQLKYYDERIKEIRKAMNYFWDLLEGVPGIQAHRIDESDGSNMAGWYIAHGILKSDELGGLSVTRFCEALCAEGVSCSMGVNNPLHTHGIFKSADIYNHGMPTRIANTSRDVRELDRELPQSRIANSRTYSVPWFKHYRPEVIQEYAEAYKKVALGYKELLEGDKGNNEETMGIGRWFFYKST